MEGPPPKQQQQPSGSEAEMKPRPVALDVHHKGSGKLRNKARNANARMHRWMTLCEQLLKHARRWR